MVVSLGVRHVEHHLGVGVEGLHPPGAVVGPGGEVQLVHGRGEQLPGHEVRGAAVPVRGGLLRPGPGAALFFLTHKNTGINKILYCQNLSFRLGNFYKAPELDMKYPQLSAGVREKCIRPELLGSRLVKLYKAPELDIKHD